MGRAKGQSLEEAWGCAFRDLGSGDRSPVRAHPGGGPGSWLEDSGILSIGKESELGARERGKVRGGSLWATGSVSDYKKRKLRLVRIGTRGANSGGGRGGSCRARTTFPSMPWACALGILGNVVFLPERQPLTCDVVKAGY